MCAERKIIFLCGHTGRRLGWERCEFYIDVQSMRTTGTPEQLEQWRDLIAWSEENCRDWEPKTIFRLQQRMCRLCQRRLEEAAGRREPIEDET